MVLVDTSVWIRALAFGSPYKPKLDRLLSLDQVLAHDLVFGELLIGDRGGRLKLLVTYSLIPRVSLIAHGEVVELVRRHRLHGRGAGWIDIHLLASALAANAKFWTADTRLHAIAERLGVAYES